MPLTGSEDTLAALIKTKRLAGNPDAQIIDNDALDADCQAIAEAVVEHLLAVVVVSPIGAVPMSTAPGGGPVGGTGVLV